MTDKVIPFPLSSPDKTINVLLNEAVTQTLSRIAIDKKLMEEANVFLLGLTGESFLYLFLTTDGLAYYHSKVFTNSNVRDLVYSIYSAFVARYSNGQEELEALSELIARSATILSADTKGSLIPEELSSRLMSYEDILEQLNNNPWVVSISLILMYWNQGMTLAHAKA